MDDLELYTLDTFQKDEVIEGYVSIIWTERYTKNGEVRLVLPVTSGRVTQLAEGRFISERNSDEIMLLETQSIDEEGLMTVAGKSLEGFFNERYFRNSADVAVNEWKARDHPGTILSTMVNVITIAATAPGLSVLGGVLNRIQNLTLGAIDISDPIVTRAVPFGPMYDSMLAIAETYKLGMKLYLDFADGITYGLKFSVYKGVDRTSAQLERDVVQFSPAQDSMSNTKELNSISGFKNVVYMYPPSWSAVAPIVEYAPGVDPAVTGFDRRILVSTASVDEAEITGGVTLNGLMHQQAKDLLANNNFTKLVDGEVVPQPGLEYRVHYNLGDIVELVGHNGVVQRALITEYIRSKDETGDRAYPTVSVID